MCKSCRHLAKQSNYTYKTKAQHCERRLVSLYIVCLRHKGGNLTAVSAIPTRFMLYFNACPKCKKGTIEYTEDSGGKYISCLMCGFNKNSQSSTKISKKTKIS